MNKARREALEQIQQEIMDVCSRLEDLRDEEWEYFENMPESIQMGEKGDSVQETVDTLDEAISSLEGAVSLIEDVIQ